MLVVIQSLESRRALAHDPVSVLCDDEGIQTVGVAHQYVHKR